MIATIVSETPICIVGCLTLLIKKGITLAEKHGLGEFADVGPIKIGTPFFDRNRCLPWAMDEPCIVCEENCPVSPKAIYTQECFNTVQDGILTVKKVTAHIIEVEQTIVPGKFASGDYYCAFEDGKRRKITANRENFLEIYS